MYIYYGIIIFIFGTIIGSFLNVCIYRIPMQESIVYPSSHCTNCGNRIKWYDLIPIVSYVILRGKCRNCREKISKKYPIVEFITGLLYLMLYIKFGISIDIVKYVVFISILIVIGIIDFDTTDIYFKTTIVGLISAFVFLGIYYYNGLPIRTYIYGGIAGGGLLVLIILITKGGMGWGDAEICLICGLFLGLKFTFVMLFLSFIIGAIIGVILILSGKKSKKDYIPFGPFITAASVITVFCGQNILSWYL
ncbi:MULTISPECIES: prepilin peptidase [Clostridium]|uniref:Type 4 prepilin-like proteins leader peptide-processing enzyme n=2 Tax=Clostridium TaxID=1485 RepID=A0A166STV5_9CLOT|nr:MULTISPECIES: A24 family peptidase [Clostridium]AGY76850.1 prepilin peptidase [Clostridium autoethanogenum DSM 10061]ALU36999.1 Prepilin peptidase [Clostridium autoethanogenum DSM 10061]OAA92764.1 Type 4 prepilin-like proteins leader peptide-processing enzyme [Clostridium coskatii]OBR97703.1 type 4 prepilin-like proteins leader peptide-processing enzyme [Clostridium coskatii]OVY48695.1 Type 4 prepilin-like proteins leader peptide-processing enzyme [Clostridium autoethanogenum]